MIIVTLEAHEANNSEAPSANEWPVIHIHSIVRDILGIINDPINNDVSAFLFAKCVNTIIALYADSIVCG